MKEKKSRRSDKTPEELLQQHKDKISHQVESIDKWCNYLVKAVRSKKHRLTSDEVTKVKDAVIAIFNDAIEGVEPTQAVLEERFRL